MFPMQRTSSVVINAGPCSFQKLDKASKSAGKLSHKRASHGQCIVLRRLAWHSLDTSRQRPGWIRTFKAPGPHSRRFSPAFFSASSPNRFHNSSRPKLSGVGGADGSAYCETTGLMSGACRRCHIRNRRGPMAVSAQLLRSARSANKSTAL